MLALRAALRLACSSLLLQSGSPAATFSIYRSLASESSPDQSGSSWLPGWMKSKLPRALGGEKDASVEDLTLDSFASSLKQARRLGGLTGFVHGTGSISDPTAQGTMRLFESIIGAMSSDEKDNLSSFNAAARQRVANDVGCTTTQVDDCIARYLWMKSMTSKLAELKRQGKEMPKSMTEIESMLGSWRQYKSESIASSMASGGAALAGEAHTIVPFGTKTLRGQECPLVGIQVSRNTKCPLTRKAFKNCCGKR